MTPASGGEFRIGHGHQVVIGPAVALFRGLVVPPGGGCQIGFGTETVLVHDAQIRFGLIVAGSGDIGETGQRLFILALVVVADALVEFGIVIGGFCRQRMAGEQGGHGGDAAAEKGF